MKTTELRRLTAEIIEKSDRPTSFSLVEVIGTFDFEGKDDVEICQSLNRMVFELRKNGKRIKVNITPMLEEMVRHLK